MPQLTKEELLTQITDAQRLTQLSVAFKELPDHLEGLAISDKKEIINHLQQQNELLHQKRDIVCMTPKQREAFLDKFKYSIIPAEETEVVKFAKIIQDHVLYELIFEFTDGTVEELNVKSLEVNDYLYSHQDDTDANYAFNVAMSEIIGIEMIKEVKKLISACNIDDIRNLLLALTQAISIAATRYQYICEHTLILQQCYDLTMEKFAQMSKNTFLRRYVDQIAEPRQVPMSKPTRFMFS